MVRNSEAGFEQELKLKVNTLRMLEKKKVALTPEQEAELKKLPPEGRAFKKAQFLDKAEKDKAELLKTKIQELEEFVGRADIPDEKKEAIQQAINDAKDNGNQISPQNADDIKDASAQNDQKPTEKKKEAFVGKVAEVAMLLLLTKTIVAAMRQIRNVRRVSRRQNRFDPEQGRRRAA